MFPRGRYFGIVFFVGFVRLFVFGVGWKGNVVVGFFKKETEFLWLSLVRLSITISSLRVEKHTKFCQTLKHTKLNLGFQ